MKFQLFKSEIKMGPFSGTALNNRRTKILIYKYFFFNLTSRYEIYNLNGYNKIME